jgi:hypothetical protein
MSAKTGGSMATLLMSVPLAAIPLMAIFGIPQFAPVVASPDDDEVTLGAPDRDHREGSSYRRRAADLLDDYEGSRTGGGLSDAPLYDAVGTDGQFTGDARDARRSGSAVRAAESASRPRPANDVRLYEGPAAARDTRAASWQDTERAAQSASDDASHAAPFDPESAVRFAETGGVAESERAPLNWREAARELDELGIEDYHLERGTDAQSFLFVCSFTPGDSPHVTLRFEAEAQEPLAAVSNVLDQVNVWLRRRFAASRRNGSGLGDQP